MCAVNTATTDPLIRLDNSYARLPEAFFARLEPRPVSRPGLVRLNRPLALELGLDPESLESEAGVQILAGNRAPENAELLAMAYAGHQFGHFVPSLGDGRAMLLGEVLDRDGIRRDIHLKGSGPTPFSRMGDGRAAYGPVIREYVVSEAMAALGIPTTRALAMLTTGEAVYRERPEPGAILVRVGASHVRVGTFEYFHRRGDADSVRTLADYVIGRHYPYCREAHNPYAALLGEVASRQGTLVAQWMLVGFIHGVMNTDNMSVAGETIDYGPCAFMDRYSAEKVYSSIDHGGRYAYNQQPRIAFWNLAQLANSLLGLIDDDEDKAVRIAQDSLEVFAREFEKKFHGGLCAKIGLTASGEDGGLELAFDMLNRMSEQEADFTNTFRLLAEACVTDSNEQRRVRDEFKDPRVFDDWAQKWNERLRAESLGQAERRDAMRSVNPAYIPRNHRVQDVIDAAYAGDPAPLEKLLTAVGAPFDDQPELSDYTRPPAPEEEVHQTFCGT